MRTARFASLARVVIVKALSVHPWERWREAQPSFVPLSCARHSAQVSLVGAGAFERITRARSCRRYMVPVGGYKGRYYHCGSVPFQGSAGLTAGLPTSLFLKSLY